MMDREHGRTVLHLLGACAVSFFLYFTGLGLPLFILPLLLVKHRDGRTAGCIAFAAEAVIVLVHGIVFSPYWESFPSIALPLMAFELYVPLSLLAAGVTWILTEGRRLEARLLYAVLPGALFLVALGIATGQNTALSAELTAHYGNVFETVLTMLLGEAPDAVFMEVFMSIFVQVTLTLAVPVTAAFACVCFFLVEASTHSRETGWEEKVTSVEFDGRIIWGMIASIALIILGRFVIMPPAVGVVLLTTAILLSFLYFIQGFSVAGWWLREKTGMKITTLFTVTVMMLLLAQGINIILFLAITLIGMAETFFDLRRKETTK